MSLVITHIITFVAAIAVAATLALAPGCSGDRDRSPEDLCEVVYAERVDGPIHMFKEQGPKLAARPRAHRRQETEATNPQRRGIAWPPAGACLASVATVRPALFTLLVAVVAPAACSGDDSPGSADANGNAIDAGDQPGCQRRTANASFSVVSRSDYGGFSGAYRTAPPPATLEEKRREGACAFYAPEPSFCDPACELDELCTVGGVCAPWPTTIPIGHLTVTGTTPTLEIDPQPGFSYYTMESYPDLFEPGDEITLSATGAGDVGPFELSTLGAPHLIGDWDDLTAIRGQPLTITWDTATASPPGTVVVVHMDSDHHGLQAYVECISDDRDGEVTVTAAVLDMLIEAGETGIGTYIENAYIERLHTGTLANADGCVAFSSESSSPIHVDTVP